MRIQLQHSRHSVAIIVVMIVFVVLGVVFHGSDDHEGVGGRAGLAVLAEQVATEFVAPVSRESKVG